MQIPSLCFLKLAIRNHTKRKTNSLKLVANMFASHEAHNLISYKKYDHYLQQVTTSSINSSIRP
jgi:hypothetical protein